MESSESQLCAKGYEIKSSSEKYLLGNQVGFSYIRPALALLDGHFLSFGFCTDTLLAEGGNLSACI